MTISPTLLGTAGVLLLLLAFGLNLSRKISQRGRLYLAMNFIGAMLAAWYAYASGAWPFVILECVWAVAALVPLLIGPKKKNSP